jgi:hypothetical protein
MKHIRIIGRLLIFMLCLTAVNLTALARANAPGQATDDRAGFRNTDEVYQFMKSYYKNPQPNRLLPAFKMLIESELMERVTIADEYHLAGFFGCAAVKEPNVIDGYKNLFEPAAHGQRLLILKVLQLCANKSVAEYFISQIQAGRFINEQKEIEQMLAAGTPMSVEDYSKMIGAGWRVYLLFGEYCATGRAGAIDELIDTFNFEEPRMSATDVNSIKQSAQYILSLMCRQNAEVMEICKQRIQVEEEPAKGYLERLIDSIDGSISAEKIIENPPEIKVVSGPKGWALGCCAVLMERNYSRHDTLEVKPINESVVHSIRGLLDEWWGIRNKKDLLESLQSLETRGHRSSFDRTAAQIVALSDEQYKAITEPVKDDKEKLQELEVARKYAARLAGKSILGWDYARYIAVCRWGYTVGLFSEEEAWDKIMPIAKKLQGRFTSWEDLGCNYLIGRQFWSYKETIKNGALYEDAYQRLTDMPSSPWNKYPWNMNLDSDEDANDANEADKN